MLGGGGEGRGKLRGLHGLAIDSSYVYVSEYYNNCVSVFTLEGQFLKSFGCHGSGPGQFRLPRGLAVDSSGVLYVCEEGNNRVQLF